jgi:hypothetical protein
MVAKGAAIVGSWTSRESSVGSTKVGKATRQVSLEARKQQPGRQQKTLTAKQRLSEQGHVEHIDQSDTATTDGDLNSATAFDGNVTVISNTDEGALKRFKLGEDSAIVPHVGGGTAVNDGENGGQQMRRQGTTHSCRDCGKAVFIDGWETAGIGQGSRTQTERFKTGIRSRGSMASTPAGGRLKLTGAFTGTTTAALITGTTQSAVVVDRTKTWVAGGIGILGSTGGGSGTGGAGTGARTTRATRALAAGFLVTACVQVRYLHVSSLWESG